MRFNSAQGLTDQPLRLSISDDKIKLYKFLKRRAKEMTESPTLAEMKLSNMLDDLSVHYEYQKVIPPYIADFVIMSKKLIIEVDGDHHDNDTNQQSHDSKRDEFLNSLGFIVLRFTNKNILENPVPVLNHIIEYKPRYETKRFYNNVQEHEYGFLNNRTSRRVFYHYFRKALKRELRKIWDWKYKGDMLPKIGLGIILLLILNCSSIWAQEQSFFTQASWYSNKETHNRPCADGERLDDEKMCAASWDYPLGTKIRVQVVEGRGNMQRFGKSVILPVRDRGPAKRLYCKGRKIDLSKAAFRFLSGGHLEKGIITVQVEPIGRADSGRCKGGK